MTEDFALPNYRRSPGEAVEDLKRGGPPRDTILRAPPPQLEPILGLPVLFLETILNELDQKEVLLLTDPILKFE